jgi:predicted small lipoprotein YifL
MMTDISMHAIRPAKKPAFALCLLLSCLLIACGQRGPLFLPDKNAGTPAAPNAEAADQQQPEEKDDPGS